MQPHALRFEAVTYRYPDGHEALAGLSFALRAGERAAVVGANGAGKSTLLLHTDGLLLPTAGRLYVDGIAVERRSLTEIRRRVGYLFQQPDDQLFLPTVRDDVAFGPANMGLGAAEIERRVDEALAAVGASELRDRTPARLSVGQKKRVAIATLLAMRPSLLVMDEPTASLDPRARRQLLGLLDALPHTALIATHDLQLVRALCPRILVLHRGRLLADGPTRELLRDRALLRAAELL